MTEEIMPCPFCGEKARALGCCRGYSVECENCGARTADYLDGLVTNDKARQLAVDAWNKRSSLGITQTANSLIFTATGSAKQGEERGLMLGKAYMKEHIEKELLYMNLLTDEIREIINRIK